MTDAITTGVFGTLILVAIGYLVSRVDRMTDRLEQRMDALDRHLGDVDQRVARIEGRLGMTVEPQP